MRRAMGGRRWWPAVLGTALVGALVGVFAALALSLNDPDASFPESTGGDRFSFAVLDDAPTPTSEAVAERLGDGAFAAESGIDLDAVRPMIERPGVGLYVAPTTRNWICVIVVSAAASDVPATSCLPRAEFDERPAAVEIRVGDSMILGGAAPDGYDAANLGRWSASVEHNGFMFEGRTASGYLRVTGKGMDTLTLGRP